MSVLFQEAFTLAQAAAAAGVSTTQARNWTSGKDDRPELTLGDPAREAGRWRRFSPLHVYQIAIVGRLVASGVSLKDAQGEAANVIAFLGADGNFGISAALNRLEDQALYVIKEPNATFFGLRTFEELAPSNVDNALELRVINLFYLKLRPILEDVLRALKLD